MKKVTAVAPVNIALVKYWGKRDEIAVLPYNPSISLTLDALYTETTLESKSTPGVDFILNTQHENPQKVIDFLRRFEGFNPQDGLTIRSFNKVPTAAGFASSASGFAALSVAANTYFQTNYELSNLVEITRQGSGSAVRSLLGGAVMWRTNGSIEPLNATLDDYAFIIVMIDENKKQISSREGMKRTVKTSSLYENFVSQSHKDAEDMKEALNYNRFPLIGTIMEKNALLMHATTMNAEPPFTYLKQETFEVLDILTTLRQNNILAYATIDAGPNVKILLEKKNVNTVIEALNQAGFNQVLTSKITTIGAHLKDE